MTEPSRVWDQRSRRAKRSCFAPANATAVSPTMVISVTRVKTPAVAAAQWATAAGRQPLALFVAPATREEFAGIDVLDVEPPPLDHPLLADDIPNLIVSPVLLVSSVLFQRWFWLDLTWGAVGTLDALFAGALCYREKISAATDPVNCREVTGRIRTELFVSYGAPRSDRARPRTEPRGPARGAAGAGRP